MRTCWNTKFNDLNIRTLATSFFGGSFPCNSFEKTGTIKDLRVFLLEIYVFCEHERFRTAIPTVLRIARLDGVEKKNAIFEGRLPELRGRGAPPRAETRGAVRVRARKAWE